MVFAEICTVAFKSKPLKFTVSMSDTTIRRETIGITETHTTCLIVLILNPITFPRKSGGKGKVKKGEELYKIK